MKKLITLACIMAAFSFANETTAQNMNTRESCSAKKTINSSKKEIAETTHKSINYYIIDGMWHTKVNNQYVLRMAPKGARINFKPEGGETVKMAGKNYYKYQGIFYKKLKDNLYEVVRI